MGSVNRSSAHAHAGRLPKEYEEAYDKAGLKFGCLPGEEIWDVDARQAVCITPCSAHHSLAEEEWTDWHSAQCQFD